MAQLIEMIVLIKLLLAHFLGDFVFQPLTWVKEKEAKKIRALKLYLHLVLHGILVLVLLWDVSYTGVATSVMLAHGLIDLLKLYAQKKHQRPFWFIIDQVLHLLSLGAIWYLFFKPQLVFPETDLNLVWIFAVALLFLTVVSGIVIQVLMSHWSYDFEKEDKASLKEAGKYIGILERLFVFTFVVTGHWEGIGFLLAAKSVFRFGDLRKSEDRRLTEYVMIGTLLSFGLAVATGLLINGLS